MSPPYPKWDPYGSQRHSAAAIPPPPWTLRGRRVGRGTVPYGVAVEVAVDVAVAPTGVFVAVGGSEVSVGVGGIGELVAVG